MARQPSKNTEEIGAKLKDPSGLMLLFSEGLAEAPA
jgi:hypothetical protein